ncbi:SRPBCC family protein [Streptomyces sp. CoH27]|uniref:aromatase/cyclase n=1 Tax=Streptomyces sp. CoH27 TaxID=2875763 RepID=UPI001CD4E9AC|nr:SRPBCC family protein [Streptomyces sp. CoH27]
MPVALVHRVVSEAIASAPAGVLYGLIADATQWPLFFPHYVHVERLGFDGAHERLRSWVISEGRIHSWVASRELDVARRRVTFSHEMTDAPIESMSGELTVHSLGDRSRMELGLNFTVTGDAPADLAWAERVAHATGRAQLDRLAWLAEHWLKLDDLLLYFEDTVRFEGSSDAVIDFLYRAENWPAELRHMRSVHLVEKIPGVQVMSVDSLADGDAQHTESVRLCFPGAGRLVHKETVTSALVSAYTCEWSVEPDESGLVLTARHHVLLQEDAIAGVLGEHATVADAGQYVRAELSRQGRLVLHQARRHAASGVPVR